MAGGVRAAIPIVGPFAPACAPDERFMEEGVGRVEKKRDGGQRRTEGRFEGETDSPMMRKSDGLRSLPPLPSATTTGGKYWVTTGGSGVMKQQLQRQPLCPHHPAVASSDARLPGCY